MSATNFPIGNVEGQIKELTDHIVPHRYTVSKYGISYELLKVGKIVQINTIGGTLNQAIAEQGTYVSLSDFDNSLSADAFLGNTTVNDAVTYAKRVNTVPDTGNVVAIGSRSSSEAVRFCLTAYLK